MTPDRSFVWLVLTPRGTVVAVLEDDAEYAATVRETNRAGGWTVERRSVMRNQSSEVEAS